MRNENYGLRSIQRKAAYAAGIHELLFFYRESIDSLGFTMAKMLARDTK